MAPNAFEALRDDASHVVLDRRIADHSDRLEARPLHLRGGLLDQLGRAGGANDPRALTAEASAMTRVQYLWRRR